MGTGFLASPGLRLLVTNNHVLPDAATAADTEATFRFEEDARGRTTRAVKVRLDPGRCFLTSPARRAGLHGRRGGDRSQASRRARCSAPSRWSAPPARSSAGTR